MILIVGLGNPGSKYKNTRHNIGRMVVSSFADFIDTSFEYNKWANAHMATGILDGLEVELCLPETFMNNSGSAVSFLQKKLKPENIIVVYDDADLEFGRIKITKGGGAGGHNGLKDIISKIGSSDFIRLRIGIANNYKKTSLEKFVLSEFIPEEKKELQNYINYSVEAIKAILLSGEQSAMNKFNAKNEKK